MTRQPALTIGLIVTVIFNVLATLVGFGFISDVQAGHVKDAVNAIVELLIAISPLLVAAGIWPFVTPTAAPQLELGTPVTTPTGQPAIVNGAAPSSQS